MPACAPARIPIESEPRRATPTCPTTSPTTQPSPRPPAGRRRGTSTTLLDDVFAWLREHRATLEPVLGSPVAGVRASSHLINHACRPHHRRVRPHRLRSRALLRQQGLRHRRGRQRHAAVLLRRRWQHRRGAGRGWSAACAATGTSHADIRDEQAMDRIFRDLRARDRARHPCRGAAVARLGGARAPHRLHRQRQRHAEPARDDAAPLPRCALHLHEHEQGLRRHAEPPAARRARDALGGRRRPPLQPSTASTKR